MVSREGHFDLQMIESTSWHSMYAIDLEVRPESHKSALLVAL